MIRRSAKVAAITLADLNRWYAAEWSRSRDIRMIEARAVIGSPLTRAALVRIARRANHEFIRYMREVRV